MLNSDKIYKENKERSKIRFNKPSLAQQQFKDQTDINNIISRFIRSGDPSVLSPYLKVADYVDITDVPRTLEDAYAYIDYVQEQFNSIPANIRRRFGDDYRKFVDYINTNPSIDSLFSNELLTKQEYERFKFDNLNTKDKLQKFTNSESFKKYYSDLKNELFPDDDVSSSTEK